MIEWWIWLGCSIFIFVMGALIVRVFKAGMDENQYTMTFTFIVLLSVAGPIGLVVLGISLLVWVLFCFFNFLTGKSFIPQLAKDAWRDYARHARERN